MTLFSIRPTRVPKQSFKSMRVQKYFPLISLRLPKKFNLLLGDYILVWGDADEDGFFDGELLDGRRGLVPSNFVEKLEGEELLDFHRQVHSRKSFLETMKVQDLLFDRWSLG